MQSRRSRGEPRGLILPQHPPPASLPLGSQLRPGSSPFHYDAYCVYSTPCRSHTNACPGSCLTPDLPRPARCYVVSINEKGLYEYLLINDDLDEAVSRLAAIAARAAAGQPAEPGMVPERVVLEDVSEEPRNGFGRDGNEAVRVCGCKTGLDTRWRDRRRGDGHGVGMGNGLLKVEVREYR